jgi:hypothetical protein
MVRGETRVDEDDDPSYMIDSRSDRLTIESGREPRKVVAVEDRDPTGTDTDCGPDQCREPERERDPALRMPMSTEVVGAVALMISCDAGRLGAVVRSRTRRSLIRGSPGGLAGPR